MRRDAEWWMKKTDWVESPSFFRGLVGFVASVCLVGAVGTAAEGRHLEAAFFGALMVLSWRIYRRVR